MLEALGQGPYGRPLSICLYTILHVDVDISVRPYVRRQHSKQSPPQVREFNPNFERPPYLTYFERWGEGDSCLKLVLRTVGSQN